MEKRRKRRRINKVRMAMTMIVVIVLVVAIASVRSIISLHIEQSKLEKNNASLRSQKAQLTEELKNVNDLNYIEEQARVQLKLIKPGETLYILEENEKNAQNQKDGSDKNEQDEKNSNDANAN